MDRNNILKRQIANLDNYNFAELAEKFEELYGFECGATNVRNLRMRIAYKLQELYFGGLPEEDMKKLAEIAQNDLQSQTKLERRGHKPRLVVRGTRIQRVWKGVTYEVIYHKANQYEYNGEFYRSLSAIACKITGTHWNGKKFFGVN